MEDIVNNIQTIPSAIRDPIIIDDVMSYLADGDGERISEQELNEYLPELYNNLYSEDHDFGDHFEYQDITNQYKFYEPNTVNMDETYRVYTRGDVTYVVDDEIIKAREYTISDEIGGLFNSDEIDKSLLVRGKTMLEKYKLPTTDKLLGIKRKRYTVDKKAVLLEQDIDRTLKFKKTKGGKQYLDQGQPEPHDIDLPVRGLLDD